MMGENGRHADSGVDPWNRLVALIDCNLNASAHDENFFIEFWSARIWDAALRDFGQQHWARYRAPFLKTVVEGCAEGVFTPALSPEVVVDLLLAMLPGAMVPRVLGSAPRTADVLRVALLQQVAQMLGRAY